MKFIMTKCIRSVCIHVNVEHKTHVNVKLCKSILSYVKQCKTMSLLFGGKGSGRGKIFKMFLVMGQSKWPITTHKKTLKTFVLVDAPKPIKLINMNNNKYPSSCKSLGQK